MDNLIQRIEALEASYNEFSEKINNIENDKLRNIDLIIIENKLDMILEHLGLINNSSNETILTDKEIFNPDFSAIKNEIESLKNMFEHN